MKPESKTMLSVPAEAFVYFTKDEQQTIATCLYQIDGIVKLAARVAEAEADADSDSDCAVFNGMWAVQDLINEALATLNGAMPCDPKDRAAVDRYFGTDASASGDAAHCPDTRPPARGRFSPWRRRVKKRRKRRTMCGRSCAITSMTARTWM